MWQMFLGASFLFQALTAAAPAITTSATASAVTAPAPGTTAPASRPSAAPAAAKKSRKVAKADPKASPQSTKASAPAAPAPAATAPAPAAPGATAPRTAAEVVAAVQKYYVGIEKLEADFKQTYTNTVFGRKSESLGRLFIAKPGKMRWDYQKPRKKQFISDGKTLWVAEPANKQAYKQNLKDQVLPVAVTFLYGQGNLAKDFVAALDPGKYGGKDDLVVKLTPKQPSAQYKTLWIVVDPTDFHVKESIILESSNNTNHFRFVDVKTNAGARYAGAARYYRFTPPKDWKVITGPAPGAGGPG